MRIVASAFFCFSSALIQFSKLNDDAAQALVAGLQIPFLLPD